MDMNRDVTHIGDIEISRNKNIVNMEKRTPPREYRMKDRAKARDETRERIIRATMQLHDEKGVAATSFVDVAKRAGTGAATVYRHFPDVGALVTACGAHVWQEMRPPRPDQAAAAFEGLVSLEDRLRRLVEELDAFYRRGALRLERAASDRHRIRELDGFLTAVEAGVAAWVHEAVKLEPLSASARQLVVALTDFRVWASLRRVDVSDADRARLMARLLRQAIA